MHMQEKPDNQEGVKIGDVMMSADNGSFGKNPEDLLEDSYN